MTGPDPDAVRFGFDSLAKCPFCGLLRTGPRDECGAEGDGVCADRAAADDAAADRYDHLANPWERAAYETNAAKGRAAESRLRRAALAWFRWNDPNGDYDADGLNDRDVNGEWDVPTWEVLTVVASQLRGEDPA